MTEGLTVVEKLLPLRLRDFTVFMMFWGKEVAIGIKTVQALICLNGSCEVYVHDGETESIFLDRPDKCLILNLKTGIQWTNFQ